jgi:hypothetical protein
MKAELTVSEKWLIDALFHASKRLLLSALAAVSSNFASRYRVNFRIQIGSGTRPFSVLTAVFCVHGRLLAYSGRVTAPPFDLRRGSALP